MEVGLNAPYELEDGELHQEDCSDYPNHVKKGATNLDKSVNKIADPALRMDGQQQALENLSGNQNYMQGDAYTIREDGKEYVDISFQEGSVPSLQNTEGPYDYQNHIQSDIHKKPYRNDRNGTGDMNSEPITHQQRWKRRYKDVNKIQNDGLDDRKDGNTITNVNVPKRNSNEQSTKKKKILDSNHMGIDTNEPYELEDGELHQEDCSGHPNHVKKGATNLDKSVNKIADPALRMDGQQQALENLSGNQNYMQGDASTLREDGKEYVGISFQECSVPSLQNTEGPYDYQNHIQCDIHKKPYRNDRNETGDMNSEPITHQQRWKRRYKDVNQIQNDGIDDRKDGNTITNFNVPKRDSNEQSTKKKKILDSNHMGIDTNEPIEVGVNPRDSSRFIRGTYKNTDRKDIRDKIIREPMSDQKNWKDRSHADVNLVQTDGFHARKTGEAIGGIFRQEKKPSETTSEKQSFQDSKHKEKEADEPTKARVEFGDMRRTIRDWIDSKAEDHSIIWPPVVIIENIITGFNKTTNKWDGLKSNEIKSCLKSIKDLEYKKVTVIYNNRDGHRGSAVVIFDANETGFMNADNLSQCLQRATRGREDWCAVRPRGLPVNETDMEWWTAKGLVGDDGTRLIYGYLAKPSDLDRLKRHVPRVSIESFVKKVLEPMKRRCQETEKVSRDIQELEEEREQKKQALESQKLEVNRVEVELKKKDDEVQHYRKQQDEAEKSHKLKMEENRRKFDKLMKEKYLRYQQRETEIRAKLYANKMHFEKETEEYTKTENELEEGIEKEKNEQKQKLAEIRRKIVLREQRLEKDLQAKMEKKYAQLEEKIHEKKLELQAKHHKQVLEFKEKVQKEKQQFLQRKLEEKNELEKELESARQETNKLSSVSTMIPEAEDCAICHTKFGPKVSRALYDDCGHKDVCLKCAKKQKIKRKCPICERLQAKSYIVVPYKIFC